MLGRVEDRDRVVATVGHVGHTARGLDVQSLWRVADADRGKGLLGIPVDGQYAVPLAIGGVQRESPHHAIAGPSQPEGGGHRSSAGAGDGTQIDVDDQGHAVGGLDAELAP